MTISAERLREVFEYRRDTGEFVRIKKTGRKGSIGDICGTVNANGYIVIGIDGRVYYAHQLAWLYETGLLCRQIDHRDGNRSNNRWNNLREATHSQNIFNSKLAKNNSSGRKGVSWHKRAQKWAAHFNHNGKKHHLGLFVSIDDAHAAYLNAVSEIEPEYVRAK